MYVCMYFVPFLHFETHKFCIDIFYDFCKKIITISWYWKFVTQQHDGVSMNKVKEHHLAMQQRNMKTKYNNTKKCKKTTKQCNKKKC
jgi:hypothetical protein